MKRISFCLCCCLLIGFLSGCNSSQGASGNAPSVNLMVPFTHTVAALSDTTDLLFYTWDSPDYDTCLDTVYNLSTKDLEKALYCFSNGASADQVMIVETHETNQVKSTLETYVQNRMADFTGYAPEEVQKLNQCQLFVQDDLVVLLVGEDSDKMKAAFHESLKSGFSLNEDDLSLKEEISTLSLSGNTQEEDDTSDSDETELLQEIPGKMDIYDTSAIITAYKTGDESGLSDVHDQKVLEICKKVIDQIITEDMTDYEKELAVHDYLVTTLHYDETALSNEGYYPKYSDQPYGALVNHSAICLGYATTFQLFMDLLDIKSMIVTGSAYTQDNNHGWNIVKLDDGWYWVDVTWDDPVGTSDSNDIDHYFFNTDDTTMKNSGHNWKVNHYPSANGIKYKYKEN